MTEKEKTYIKSNLIHALSNESEILKIVVFGSFIKSKYPNDIDVAVFQNSKKMYLDLSMKYRRLTRDVAEILPIDIVPLKAEPTGVFLEEINSGETIYEK